MYGYESVQCPNCSDTIPIHVSWLPLDYVERDPDESNPRSLFVIARDRLLHSCPIGPNGWGD